MDINNVWRDAKKNIMDKVSAISFDLWIKTLEPVLFKDGEFVLVAQTTNGKNQAQSDRHFPHIDTEIRDLAPIVEKVVIIDAVELEKRNAQDEGEKVSVERAKSARFIPVDPTKTFDSFIVGKSNEFVAAAAEAVAKSPGKKINPLFIYGNSGLGKTHLLHSIANSLSVEHPNLRVAFVTCENFLNDYVDAIKAKAVTSFREQYRSIDVLLIDDIHIIENKSGTQEEFFHTFNDLYQNKRQIVLVSDRHADKFLTLEERMRSRFKSGLIHDISSPDVELRMAILQKKATLENYRLDLPVTEFLANHATDNSMNVREMEGMLYKVVFYAGLKNRVSPTLEDCASALQTDAEEKREQLTAKSIIGHVSKYFNVSKEEITGKKRNREFVEPRMVAVYLISEHLNVPLVNIGKIMGNRDHTTIMHARNKIASLLKDDSRIKRIVEDLLQVLRNS